VHNFGVAKNQDTKNLTAIWCLCEKVVNLRLPAIKKYGLKQLYVLSIPFTIIFNEGEMQTPNAQGKLLHSPYLTNDFYCIENKIHNLL
jgi:hypothetical protein